MKQNKKIWIFVLGIFLLAFPFHFVYDGCPNFLFSILFPVNESIWEHMKLLFTSYLFFGLIEYPLLKYFHMTRTYELFTVWIGAVILIPIFLVLYLPITSIIAENMIVTFILMFIAIAITKFIQFYFMENINYNPNDTTILSVILIIISYMIFGILTYHPIKVPLFYDQQEKQYGIIDKTK